MTAPIPVHQTGNEWVVDAHGCRPAALRSVERIDALFARVVDDLELQAIGAPVRHVFPGTGGLTVMQLLGESHLACHTFPERGYAAINLYCCSPRAAWAWEPSLQEVLGAAQVVVRVIERGIPATAGAPRGG